jgi:serine/threonine protein kinase
MFAILRLCAFAAFVASAYANGALDDRADTGNLMYQSELLSLIGAGVQAPELFNTKLRATEKVDVYSFGVLLWECCALQRPWAGMSTWQVAMVVENPRNTGLPLLESWPKKLRDMMSKCVPPPSLI